MVVKTKKIIYTLVGLIIAFLTLSPFYFLIINSMKNMAQIADNPGALPDTLYFGNYINSFKILKFPNAFLNSSIVTVTSVAAIVFISSMAAYRLVRHKSKFNIFLFFLFISAMVIPFQSIMIPMVKVAGIMKLINSYLGVMCVYLGFGVSFAVFLFHGFIKSIPLEIEEAAGIDGCSSFGIYWRIVFPLLKPVVVTVIILDGLWIWNDFLLPFLIIPASHMRTIPLAISSFFGQYTKRWDLATAALILSTIPVIIIFISLQKHIIEGIVAGAVKR